MPSLSFECSGVTPDRYAASPTLLFGLKVGEDTGARIHTGVLRCQIRIEPQRRRYDDDEAARLLDLFGERTRWGDTLKPLQFATVPFVLPAFTGSTEVDVAVPCSYDFEVAAAKYFHALRGGEIPLLMLFSGTVFYRGGDGMLVDQIPWDREINVRVPVATWRTLMDLSFPGSAWLRMRVETVDALQDFKSRHGLTTWDETVELLLRRTEEVAR
jgi:hypothetical protein